MEHKINDIKKSVKDGYAKIAIGETSCCCSASCCSSSEDISRTIGYSNEEMKSVPQGANLGLGCGNPVAIASLKEGDVVLDLGSGAGFDAFLAAQKVGAGGRVIGVDMTSEMIEKAKANAATGRYSNVEFRFGEIENLPIEDGSIDVIISNCVINLSPDKQSVFKEAFRVLKPGGRLMVSDLVLVKELPETIRKSVAAYIGCIAGAIMKDHYLEHIKAAGFQEVRIIEETDYPFDAAHYADALADRHNSNAKEEVNDMRHSVTSIKVSAIKF